MARTSSRAFLTSFAALVQPPACSTCRRAALSASRKLQRQSLRAYSTSSSEADTSYYESQQPQYPQERPRWQQTPPRMTAPFRTKPPTKFDNEFTVNEDPALLDRAYERVLGKGGSQLLTEEVKWLAVTHKSFDHGRRGYNDRLAYFGMGLLQCG